MMGKRRAAAACLASLLLTCCAAPASSGAASAPLGKEPAELRQEAFELPFEMICSPDLTSYGSGNAEGFYSVFPNEDDSRNILYVDYATASQVYLCAQPNCEHNSENCPSWIAPFGGTVTAAACEDELFLFYNGYGGGTRIERADLNGENRRTLLTLPCNVQAQNAVAFNGEFLVFALHESDNADGVLTRTDRLVAADVNGGDLRTLFSLEEHLPEEEVESFWMNFMGVTDEGFLLQTWTLLKYDSAATGEQLIQNMEEATRTAFYQVPFDGGAPEELLYLEQGECEAAACGGALFCVVPQPDGSLALKRMEKGAERTLCPDLRTLAPERDPADIGMADVVLRGSVGNKLLMNFLTRAYLAENGNIEAVYSGFAVDMDTGEITSLPLTNYYAATTVPVQVLDTHGPKLLVFAQIEQTVDPVKNMLSLRRRMGLIAPEDYLAGRTEYQMVQSLRDFV